MEGKDQCKGEILTERYNNQCIKLENQISIIELRQQELQNYITSLDQTVRQIDRLVYNEEKKQKPDYNKIKNLRFISSKNIEMITDMYNTYERFEDVKFKYFKEIDSHSHNANRLINIELYKLENQTNDASDMFLEMIKYMSTIKEINVKPDDKNKDNLVMDNLKDNPEYQL